MFNGVFLGVVATSVGSRYQNILNYAISQGWALPSPAQQIVQNNLIQALISSGIFDQLDALYVLANDGGVDFSKINWINPGSNNLLPIGTTLPTFSLNDGWLSSVDQTGYLDTQYTFSGISKLSQTDACAFAWVYSAASGPVIGHAGTAGANELTLRLLNQNITSNRLMTTTTTSGNVNLSGTGLIAGYSLASSSQKYYKNAGLISSETISSQGPDILNPVALFRSQNTYANAGQGVSIFGFGKNIDSLHITLYNELNTYITNK